MSGFTKVINPFGQDVSSIWWGNTKIWSATPPTPQVSTTAKSGVTYSTDLSSLTANDIHEISHLISDNAEITNQTTAVYYDYGSTHIKLSCEKDTYSTKSIMINGSNQDFVILGFNHNTMSNASFYGSTTATGKAGITWQSRNIVGYGQMNTSSTISGGWAGCYGREYISYTSFFSSFEYKDIVNSINQTITAADGVSSLVDKMFFLSEIEVAGVKSYATYNEGTQYAWYKEGNPITKQKFESSSASWWTRSVSSTKYFVKFSSFVDRTWADAIAVGYAPAFCT